MDSQDGFRNHVDRPADGQVPKSFFDSFRWLDEEEDLDLRLFLDDYHANLREGTPTTKQRPSFRRTMSISKIPFGRRSSVSSIRPVTKDVMTPTSPIHSPTGSISNGLTHARRKSRALSLITPKHAAHPSITAFDPAAAHYQDPEARLKLRVYLASPQKFDEAVEFGFPSADVLSPAQAVNADHTELDGQPKQKSADGSSNMHTFLADHDDDDDLSLYSDHATSLGDPDSPKTPEPVEQRTVAPRHGRVASADVVGGRGYGRTTPEGPFYVQAPAASREMTLRMTLTRPDLRAHEDDMYGWQQKPVYQQHARRPTAMASLGTENRAPHTAPHKESLDKFAEVDHWNETAPEKGVMRRIWNRVRRG
jgi:methionine-rich copper-binding protein CopC